jgi:hypothetical protein
MSICPFADDSNLITVGFALCCVANGDAPRCRAHDTGLVDGPVGNISILFPEHGQADTIARVTSWAGPFWSKMVRKVIASVEIDVPTGCFP